ncbi:MAG: 23S rRNA (adenine(1618)-N(6))-methyltransferase RlmF [bacterium]|nr:23S rRNA (adenine(1618)-N(6))-methyltransferase RlmF [bacterium]
MIHKKKEHPKEKFKLHPRNKHRGRYDFEQLVKSCPELASFVIVNTYNDQTIDFSNLQAVKMLNKALLMHYYDIHFWDIPKNYLCPPIPGRADYIHYMADLLSTRNNGKIPNGSKIKCLDIGIGANCIYPIIGNKEYGWSFIGSDIDSNSIKSAGKIIKMNPSLLKNIELRLQSNPNDIFNGIIQKDELIDFSICNPPFHASINEASSGTLRKLSNLNNKKITQTDLNFGGQKNELCYKGGEERFVKIMICQSKQFAASCFWFSSLISKQSNLKTIYRALEKTEALEIKTIPMGQGNKISRIVAWTFLTKEQQTKWIKSRWNKN